MNPVRSAWQRIAELEPLPQPPVIPVKHPVVLMHGFGMLAAIARQGQLHDEAMTLRRHGVRAYAPNVAPYNPTAARAALWKERIEHVLAETGAPKVNLIAHSMGGLDARYLISRLEMHASVAALVTVSTPHRGTALCDVLHEQPDALQRWTAALFNWMGAGAMDETDPDAATAVRELTPAHVCHAFNDAVPDHADVTYWSFAGRAGRGTDVPINPALRLQNRILHRREGVNDGYVSVESARWGTFLGTVDADHLQQLGLNVLPTRRFDAGGFYLSIVRKLAEAGF